MKKLRQSHMRQSWEVLKNIFQQTCSEECLSDWKKKKKKESLDSNSNWKGGIKSINKGNYLDKHKFP